VGEAFVPELVIIAGFDVKPGAIEAFPAAARDDAEATPRDSKP